MSDGAKVYIARAGRNGEDEDQALDKNLAIIGFHDVPSLEAAKDYEAIAQLVDTARPDAKPRARVNVSRQLSGFRLAMREGDFVVLPRKLTSQIAIGRVTGPYRYTKIGGESRHTRAVDWARPRCATHNVRTGPAPFVRGIHDGVQRLTQRCRPPRRSRLRRQT